MISYLDFNDHTRKKQLLVTMAFLIETALPHDRLLVFEHVCYLTYDLWHWSVAQTEAEIEYAQRILRERRARVTYAFGEGEVEVEFKLGEKAT